MKFIRENLVRQSFLNHTQFEESSSRPQCRKENWSGTGKSLSEALLFAQHVLLRFELGIFMYWTCNSMNNLSSYFGLVDAKIRASEKDLHVLAFFYSLSILSLVFYTSANLNSHPNLTGAKLIQVRESDKRIGCKK